MAKTCTVCNKRSYSDYCFIHRPKKRIEPRGKEYYRYKAFRDDVAVPYLDNAFGHHCRVCKASEGLEIDHIHNRGSRPELKYQLSNLQWLCRSCHHLKTIGKD